jgi:hypothetical protein
VTVAWRLKTVGKALWHFRCTRPTYQHGRGRVCETVRGGQAKTKRASFLKWWDEKPAGGGVLVGFTLP